MQKLSKWTLVFASFGLLVPLAILLAKTISSTGFSPGWILYIWPSYFLLGGLAGKVDGVAIAYVVISIAINIALYAYAGSLIGRLLRGIGSARAHESRTS